MSRTLPGQVMTADQARRWTIDPACWPKSHSKKVTLPTHKPDHSIPENLDSSTTLVLEPLPSFPRSLFLFQQYDGAKALTAVFLLISFIYFLAGFLGFLVDHNAWLHDIFYRSSEVSQETQSVWSTFWHPIGSTIKQISSYVDIAFRFFLLSCTYCLAWATFDPRNIEGYIMGCFNSLLGFIYLFSPLDMIPDVMPVVGGLDDTFLGMGVLILGLSSIYRNKFRDVKTNTILELIDDGNNQKALTMLLEDKGIAINEK